MVSHFCWVDPGEVETYEEVDAASDLYGANLYMGIVKESDNTLEGEAER